MEYRCFQELGARFETAARLMRNSWAENSDQSLDYNLAFLASCYEYPEVNPSLSPILEDGPALCAFVSAFPRRAVLDGRPLRLALLSFFTVAAGMKGMGYGKTVWAERLRRACEAGYDGAVHYCVDGNRSNQVTVAAARSIGFETKLVMTLGYLIRFLRLAPDAVPAPLEASFLQAFPSYAEGLAARLC